MIEKIGKVTINLNYYNGIDAYTDGEVEDELLEIVKKENTDIEEIISKSNKWPITYHLSKTRHNILEWYNFGENKTVLEVGSGCGAITGLFSRKAKKVVAVEISKKRSLINAYRNKNCENLEIFVGNLNDIKLEEKFDYITLIGVFEYSRGFTVSEKPEIDFLNKLKQYLKPDGKIIIAIENKFGLKYWAGALEDHTAVLFDGIQGYLNTEKIATYSKTELEDILKKVDLSEIEFYYPFPDYKMSNMIYSENYLPEIGDLRGLIHNYDMNRYVFFNEGIVYDQLIKDKNMEKFSNSFLVIAKRNHKINEISEIKEIKEINEIKGWKKYENIIRKIFQYRKR